MQFMSFVELLKFDVGFVVKGLFVLIFVEDDVELDMILCYYKDIGFK